MSIAPNEHKHNKSVGSKMLSDQQLQNMSREELITHIKELKQKKKSMRSDHSKGSSEWFVYLINSEKSGSKHDNFYSSTGSVVQSEKTHRIKVVSSPVGSSKKDYEVISKKWASRYGHQFLTLIMVF